MNKFYETLKKNIDKEYPIKFEEQEIYLKNHWKSFNEDVNELEQIVSNEFKEVLKKVDLNGAKVLGYKVKYDAGYV